MNRDGRTLDRQVQEAIRLMAVERVREGESDAAVIGAYGFNRTTIYKWIKAALPPGVGVKALRSTKATGRPRSLTPTQERGRCSVGSMAATRASAVWILGCGLAAWWSN
jgi:transposase